MYQHFVIRKIASTNDASVRRYLDEIGDDIKPKQRSPYNNLDIRSRLAGSKNSYQNLEIGPLNRSHKTIRDLDFSSSSSSPPPTSDPSQLPAFEKNFYKLHPDTESFPDVSKTCVCTCVFYYINGKTSSNILNSLNKPFYY